MNPRLRTLVFFPTLLVALYSLFAGESLVSFGKKVGATYVVFSVIAGIVAAAWRAAAPPAPPEELHEPEGTGEEFAASAPADATSANGA